LVTKSAAAHDAACQPDSRRTSEYIAPVATRNHIKFAMRAALTEMPSTAKNGASATKGSGG
jgi:hypothetical protein